MQIRQFGVQRSGTNVTRKLLEMNFEDVEVVEEGKHGPFLGDDADAYVVTVKEPWAWLQSYWRYTSHSEWDLPRRFWYGLKGRSMEVPLAKHHLGFYINTLIGWKRSIPDPLIVLQYRDLLGGLETLMDGVAEVLDLARADPVRRIEARVAPEGHRTSSSFDPTYYTDRRYLDEYHPDEVEHLLDIVRGSWWEEALGRIGMDLAAMWDDPVWEGFPDRPKVPPGGP